MKLNSPKRLMSQGLKMNESAITIKNLTKKFEDKLAVEDLSLQVAKGELFGLLGPNGAGKTTTINILCGLIKPTSGTAKICGYDVLKGNTESQGANRRLHPRNSYLPIPNWQRKP